MYLSREYDTYAEKAGKTDGRSRTQCMSDAIDKCIRQGIMEDFLRKHKAEVIGMYLEEYNEEETMQMFREEGWEDGREDGIAFGKRNNQLETARRMLADGLNTDKNQRSPYAIGQFPIVIRALLVLPGPLSGAQR